MSVKKTLLFASAFALLLSASVSMASALSNAGGGEWKYYKEITVRENSGRTLNDFQVLVELNAANFDFSKAKTDGSDIRFECEGKELSYWIEEWNAGARKAKIWVKVPRIPANGEVKIKMYYGNPYATSVSDGDATFEFFDDFEDNDISDWTVVYGSATCSDGVMYVNPTSKHCKNPDHPGGDPYLFQCAALYKNYTYSGPLVAEFDFKLSKIWQGVNNGVTRVRFLYQDWFNHWEVLLGGDAEDDDYRLDKRVLGEKPTYPFGDPIVTGDTNWHTAKIIRNQYGKWELYRDGVKILEGNDPWLPKTSAFYIWFPNAPATYFDNIIIRKYTSPEPTLTFSAEYSITAQTPTPAPPTVPEGKVKAVWLYNPDKYDTSTLMNDLKSAGINTVFLSTDVNNIWKYERFVKSAHENGIKVHAMILEDPRCALRENHEISLKAVETVLDYNEKSLARFDGINIDIEPYAGEEYGLKFEQLWQDYISLMGAIHDKTSGKTELSVDIPRWYDESKIKELAPYIDFFVIMAYDSGGAGWNTASKIEDAVASVMGAIRGEGANAVIGIGVHEGFGDKEAVEKCIDDLYKYYSEDPAFSGVSIFKYESYSGLEGAPEVQIPTGEEKGIPGFESVSAVAGFLTVAYILRRYRR